MATTTNLLALETRYRTNYNLTIRYHIQRIFGPLLDLEATDFEHAIILPGEEAYDLPPTSSSSSGGAGKRCVVPAPTSRWIRKDSCSSASSSEDSDTPCRSESDVSEFSFTAAAAGEDEADETAGWEVYTSSAEYEPWDDEEGLMMKRVCRPKPTRGFEEGRLEAAADCWKTSGAAVKRVETMNFVELVRGWGWKEKGTGGSGGAEDFQEWDVSGDGEVGGFDEEGEEKEGDEVARLQFGA